MADAPSVVLVEDDVHISDLVSLYLDQSGFRVYRADNGADGLRAVSERDPRLVILDVGLPGEIDGLEVCRRLRTSSNVPVIMLTARDGEIDRVLGLELGADDYVTKPFSPRELVARVKAILRRSDGAAQTQAQANGSPRVFTTGGVEVDTGRAEARIDGAVIPLTTREFALLLYLAENKGLALSRRQLLDGAWGADWYGDERTVDVHVRQLRKKMGDALPLATVRGIGYRLE
jgi:DNA-binding response OmpR family regulator